MKRKDIFYATKRKVIIMSTSIVFISLFIFSLITKGMFETKVFSDIDRELLEQKKMVERLLTNPNSYREFEKPGPKPGLMPKNIIIIMYSEDQLYSISPNAYFDSDTLPVFSNKDEHKVSSISSNGYEFRGISIKNKDITIELLLNVDSEIQSVHQLMNSIIVSLVFLIILALISSYILSKRVIKPIKEAYDKQVFFIQDASHEMRTPLAIIKGKLELLANSYGDTIDDHFEQISKMMTEIRGLEKLNSDLLLLSKEDIEVNINVSKFNLYKLVDDIEDFYIDLAEIQNKNFKVSKNIENIEVDWDYIKIKRMLIILIENAFKYTDVNGKVVVSFEDSGKHVNISVEDNGIGIKEEDKERIFDRFFRSSDVRSTKINGSGIGLSLLKSISNTLEIKIKLDSEYGTGTKFTLTIPKNIK